MNPPSTWSKPKTTVSKCLPGMRVLLSKSYQLVPLMHQGGVWFAWNFGGPSLCFACVYVGVLSVMLLPVTGLAFLDMSSLAGVAFSPLAAFPLAARVFDKRAYNRWSRAKQVPLGVRMMRACSDGVTWTRWCNIPRRSQVKKSPLK